MVDPTGIACPVVRRGDRGRLKVPGEADRAVQMVAQGREPLLPLGFAESTLWATSEFPLHLQALGRVEVGHKAE